MVPALLPARNANAHSSRLLYTLLSFGSHSISSYFRITPGDDHAGKVLRKREEGFDPHDKKDVTFAVLIPVLVLLSGLFAGLTLGYMSLDETQLNVLSISGTPKQREYANKIKPIRKNGHLLLVTLLLANMIVNESLPVITDNVLTGGFQSVVISTALIVIFAEIIPQSLFTRHGLFLGAKLAGFTQFLIYFMGIIAWPVAKLLEFALGPHHGIIYRRAELKELIAMHSSHATHGGDLKIDTVTIIGATLDLQEKVVKQAMTPISDVFMLSIDSKLDYELLKKICQTGHSRVPVYEEVDVPISNMSENGELKPRTQKMKKILGILLVKQCVLLDPKDATPLRKIPLNKVPFVPNNEPLLGILDRFQEGRSHMAIVSRFSVEKAASVKKVVKRNLTQRLRERVGMGDSDSSDEEKESNKKNRDNDEVTEDGEATLKGDRIEKKDFVMDLNSDKPSGRFKQRRGVGKKSTSRDIEMGPIDEDEALEWKAGEGKKSRRTSFQIPKAAASMTSLSMLEQSMPADAVLAKEGAEEFLQNFDPAVMPLGIITLEDVLEELIGEEIYDEFDPQGARGDPYEVPPPEDIRSAEVVIPMPETVMTRPIPVQMPTALKSFGGLGGLGFLRSKSAPPTPPRDTDVNQYADEKLQGYSSDNDENPISLPHVNLSNEVEMPKPILLAGRQVPSIKIEAEMPSPPYSSLNEPNSGVSMEGKNRPIFVVPASAASATSRTSSPAPPLEAVLLERKRRLVGSGSVSPPAVASTTNLGATSGTVPVPVRTAVVPKGARFKSSPLGGVDRNGVAAQNLNLKEDAVAADEAGGNMN